MGLDMFAYKIKRGVITHPVDFIISLESYEEPLHSWRKHPNLHGWMEKLYKDKGGRSASFNCDRVQITKEDLDQLEKDIIKNDLELTEGFFFGKSDGSEYKDDIQFIKKARQAIQDDYDVYYTSWW